VPGSWGRFRIAQPRPVTHTRAAGDPAGLTDALLQGRAWTRSPADPLNLADSAFPPGVRTLPELISLADTPSRVGANIRTTTDALGMTDLTVALKNGITRGVTDAFGLRDPGAAMDMAEQLADALGLADGATPVATGGSGATRSPTEQLGIADTPLRTSFTVAGVEQFGLTDNPVPVSARETARAPADALGLTDSLTLVAPSNVSDPAGLTDTPLQQGRVVVGVERVGLTDVVT
jgi:hypothetical protein